mgnify:CR=1 FL=1
MINNLENKKVLVTGGTGMIGRYLVDKLIAKNCDITVVSLDNPEGLPEQVNFMRLDLTILDNCISAYLILLVSKAPQKCLEKDLRVLWCQCCCSILP